MIVIEILSFAIRPFSLSIRLFANILSGHILLHLINDSEVKVRDIENNLVLSSWFPASEHERFCSPN
jgi:hypothetical protein